LRAAHPGSIWSKSRRQRSTFSKIFSTLARLGFGLGSPLLVKIGEDIRKELAKLPVQYEVQQRVYPKCVCKQCHRGVVMPEAPDDRLKADITVVADVVVQKHGEHKPLYRQQPAFDRIGIPLTRQTHCNWVG
jgi:transposase